MNLKLRIFTAIFVLMAAMAGPGAAGEWEKIRIGTEGAYPPFNFIDEKGRLQGFDIEFADALCKEMRAACEFTVQDWDGLIPGLLANKYDCIIASMNITDERRKRVDFTEKYYSTPARFVARKSTAAAIFKHGVKGRTVGTQRATVTEYFLRDNFSDLVKIKTYATVDEAILDLIAGRLDMVFGDVVVFVGGLFKKPEGRDYIFVGPAYRDKKWFGDGIGIAVRKGNGDLVQKFNRAIQTLRENGVYQTINRKYFDFDVYGPE